MEIETLDGGITIAYLNRPERFNSLDAELLRELRDFVRLSSRDENVRCIGISGRGKAFCAGQNLKEVINLNSDGGEKIIQKMVRDFYNPLVEEISACPKPVISLANGAAVGAGAMLALVCDFCIAAESAYFSMAFVNIGLIPDTGGTYFLPKLLGRQQANYLAFTGKKILAQEAKNLGIVAEVFPDENFAEKSLEILTQLAQQPTAAIGLTKKAFSASYKNSLQKQLDLEAELQQQAAETQDFAEGVQAFIEKRKAVFKGK